MPLLLAAGWWPLGKDREMPVPEPEPQVSEPKAVESVGSRSPGVAALLEWVRDRGGHAVLDLGPAVPASFRVYSDFARRVRFADVQATWSERGWKGVLAAVPPQPEQPYDFILGWDTLDRIPAEGRGPLMERLVEVSASDAALHMVVRGSAEAEARPLRFSLEGTDRIRYEPAGPVRSSRPPILPAEMERMLEPFRVERGFTLKGGLREYVARRQD